MTRKSRGARALRPVSGFDSLGRIHALDDLGRRRCKPTPRVGLGRLQRLQDRAAFLAMVAKAPSLETFLLSSLVERPRWLRDWPHDMSKIAIVDDDVLRTLLLGGHASASDDRRQGIRRHWRLLCRPRPPA